MAEPIVTRAALRRNLGRMANMKFFKIYPNGYIDLGDSSLAEGTTSVGDSALTQQDNFWVNSYVYLPATSEERRIKAFRSNDDVIVPEYDFDIAIDTAATLEIYTKWPASVLHDCINRAVREGAKHFPDVAKNEDLIFQEYKMSYDISSDNISPTIYRLDQVWIERSISAITGYVDTTVDSSKAQLPSDVYTSDIDTDYYFSIYYGTCKGDVRPVTDATDTTNNRLAWAATSDHLTGTGADSTSKFLVWNAAKQYIDWYPLDKCRLDAVEFPNTLYLPKCIPGAYGYRMRFIYRSLSEDLAADTDETTVPQDYILYRAMALLHDMPMTSNKADQRAHQQAADYYDKLAAAYAQNYRKRTPQVQLRTEGDDIGISPAFADSIGDPLGWSQR